MAEAGAEKEVRFGRRRPSKMILVLSPMKDRISPFCGAASFVVWRVKKPPAVDASPNSSFVLYAA